MDFHTLSRKELQALCKRNKIPANITNVAMADALTALQKVEGLDELIIERKSELQQSPPRTACRTSSRRTPTKAEPESSQPLTRTRRRTRMTLTEEADQESKVEPESSQTLTRTRRASRRTSAEEADQENANVNLLENPAISVNRRMARAVSVSKKIETQVIDSVEERTVVEEKKDLLETPLVQGGRKCLTSHPRRKGETKEEGKSVQRVYSTRQSVRLLEKSMEELSLKEKENAENLKADRCCKDIEEVKQKKDVAGTDMPVVSVESFGNNSDSEICQNLSKSLEDGSELKHESHEVNDKSDCDKVDDDFNKPLGQEVGELSTEKSNGLEVLSGQNYNQSSEEDSEEEVQKEHELKEDKGIESQVDGSNALEIGFGKCNLLGILSEINGEIENFNGLEVVAGESYHQSWKEEVEMKHELEEEGIESETDDSNAPEIGSEKCSLSGVVSETDGEIEKFNGLEVVAGKSCHQSLEDEVEMKHELEEEEGIVSETDDSNAPEIGSEKCSLSGIVSEITYEEKEDNNEHSDDLVVLQAENLGRATVHDENGPKFSSAEISWKKNVEEACQIFNAACKSETEEKCDDNHDLQSTFPMEEEDENPEEVQQQDPLLPECSRSTSEAESSKPDEEVSDKVLAPSAKYNNEAFVDASVIEDDNFVTLSNKTTTSEIQTSPFCSSGGFAVQALFDVPLMQAEEFGVVPIPPSLEKTLVLKKSPYHPPVSGQKVSGEIAKSPFPADTSTVKKQITIETMNDTIAIKKENIDNSGMKVDAKGEEKVKKNVTDGDLYNKSLRQLTKELKQKLTIASKKNVEENNETKVEKKRLALQKLPENCSLAAEPKNQN